MSIELESYCDIAGSDPFDEWFQGLDTDVAYAVHERLERVRQGSFGDWKPLADLGIHELRIHLGQGWRVYIGRDGPRLVLLLGGGPKSDQKKDKRTASARWADYKQRKKEQQKLERQTKDGELNRQKAKRRGQSTKRKRK